MRSPPSEDPRQVSSARPKHDRYDTIYSVVRKIPPGSVATYGQIAVLAGLPGHARLVGYALHALPPHSGVPWHRVINARGRISLGRAIPGGDVAQRLRLEKEGVEFDAGDRVDLRRFGWQPDLEELARELRTVQE